MFAFSITGHAEGTDGRADFFVNLYSNLCMKYINNLEDLRTQIAKSKFQKLPPEHAAQFLRGLDGDAWRVPYQGQMGNFVIVLPAGKNICELYARKANQTDVERQFSKLAAIAPPPLISEKNPVENPETAANGKTHIISYTWSAPHTNKKILYMLTTSSIENAQLEALGSVSMVQE
jgi:hypothetical protein